VDLRPWLELPPDVQTALIAEGQRRLAETRIEEYYPDTGPLRRALYPKHQSFLAAGRQHFIRAFEAANRVGKTEAVGAYELVTHMTGRYPSWWRGRRFDHGVKTWLAGDTGKSVREILQPKVMGPWKQFGRGLVPKDALVGQTTKQGVAESIDTFTVRHVSGELSHGVFKSYDQGRESFQGSEQHVILLDEEPPLEIYGECLVRVMTTQGLVLLTYTPLGGMTPMVKHLRETKVWRVGCTWDEVPHLSKKEKDELWANTPAHMREARAMGIPARGSGVVFPVNEFNLLVEPAEVPAHFACIGGLDFGWDHPSAAVKLAWDKNNDVVYVVGTHRQREATPLTFSAGVRSWGSWLPWAWPHDGLQHDKGSGKQLASLYSEEGLDMLAEHAKFEDGSWGFEAGIAAMLQRMQSGRFKVMNHLSDWLDEYREYYRKDGLVVKERDDLMSATRVAVMCLRFAIPKPVRRHVPEDGTRAPLNWRTR
jgi:phage terminase large subunit-like protein